MKTISIKMLAGCILLASLAMNVAGQTKKITEPTKKKPVKMEKTKVPVVVTESFIKEYPMATYDSWYGYSTFTNEYDWYGYDPYLYSNEYPEYYVVEFEKDKTPYKTIYTKAGKKVATHRTVKSGIPALISTAMGKGEYKEWVVTKEKAEIFKDSDADLLKIYKIEVEKGKAKHILFYQSDGKLLLDKTVKS